VTTAIIWGGWAIACVLNQTIPPPPTGFATAGNAKPAILPQLATSAHCQLVLSALGIEPNTTQDHHLPWLAPALVCPAGYSTTQLCRFRIWVLKRKIIHCDVDGYWRLPQLPKPAAAGYALTALGCRQSTQPRSAVSGTRKSGIYEFIKNQE